MNVNTSALRKLSVKISDRPCAKGAEPVTDFTRAGLVTMSKDFY
jgi:hypothetical protein